MSDTDLQLLARYTRHRTEDAFAEIVRRHLDLVFSAALRQVRSPQLAEEVAQSAFTDLARNAHRLAPDTILTAWLYQVTRRIAIDVVRRESRRQLRERIATEMNSMNATADDWTHIEPLLDEAMHALDKTDRAAVLLRYFENKSLREVGETLGASEDAARKRISRAVDRLREFFAKRGVTVSASGLVVVISANAVQAAPGGLAATLSSAACAHAATTTAFASTVGILTLMTSAKTTTIIAALAVLLFVGGAVVTFYKANSRRNLAPASSAPHSASAAVAETKNRFLSRQGTQPEAAVNAETDPTLAAALARLREILYDPKRWRSRAIPDTAIKEAMTALNGHRKAAIPLFRQALRDANAEVRGRAAVGLGLIGPEARETASDLMSVLRYREAGTADLRAAWALRQMGNMPEIVPDLVQVLKVNPGMNVMVTDCILTVAGADPQLVDQTMKPLLEDSNPQVREAAAYALASVFKNQVGPEVVKVAIESLKSSDPNSQHLGLATLQNVGRNPHDPVQHLTRANLGPSAAEAIAALIEVVNNSKLEDRRTRALKLLDELDPDLRKQNSEVNVWLKNQDQEAIFTRRILSGQATVPEVIEGLAQFPKVTPVAATALARLGPEARAALPALQQAIVALQPPASASESDRAGAYDARARVADAMQKIAPDQPKPLFTKTDIRTLFDVLDGLQSDTARMQNIAVALQSVLAGLPSRGKELTPEEMRLVLNAVKSADLPAYQALAAQVKKIDPMFLVQPTP